jgi:uncharacterized damage-inducible protein DinB
MTSPVLDIIRNLYDYNAWANTRILDTAGQLAPGQWRAATSASFGSLHETLVHILGAHWLWLERWQGRSPAAMIDPASFPDPDALRTRWDQVERQTQAFVSACTEADLMRVIAYHNLQGERWAYPLWQQLVHQVNHATQHRSEAAMVLSACGYSPGWLDLLYFVDSQQGHDAGASERSTGENGI